MIPHSRLYSLSITSLYFCPKNASPAPHLTLMNAQTAAITLLSWMGNIGSCNIIKKITNCMTIIKQHLVSDSCVDVVHSASQPTYHGEEAQVPASRQAVWGVPGLQPVAPVQQV
eukprot:TRINITY_DN35960_c0_g1_i2.p2 TRINITY_DN35960_c0_g1~~TRINITY_DN35960_c0_g1_i2.p2  ORF type:complete len:114 (+),score=25.49 TRINITY_DN35960_c0_g1_i2:173-514(+)